MAERVESAYSTQMTLELMKGRDRVVDHSVLADALLTLTFAALPPPRRQSEL